MRGATGGGARRAIHEFSRASIVHRTQPARPRTGGGGLFYPGEAATLSKTLIACWLPHRTPYSKAESPGLSACGLRVLGEDGGHCLQAAGWSGRANRRGHGPSHHALFQERAFQCGRLPDTARAGAISEKAKTLASVPPFVLEPQCMVSVPDGGGRRQAGARDRPGHAETWEHSVEVQVPFLQKVLKNFKLLPW